MLGEGGIENSYLRTSFLQLRVQALMRTILRGTRYTLRETFHGFRLCGRRYAAAVRRGRFRDNGRRCGRQEVDTQGNKSSQAIHVLSVRQLMDWTKPPYNTARLACILVKHQHV